MAEPWEGEGLRGRGLIPSPGRADALAMARLTD